LPFQNFEDGDDAIASSQDVASCGLDSRAVVEGPFKLARKLPTLYRS
jgi:hypothetical protein